MVVPLISPPRRSAWLWALPALTLVLTLSLTAFAVRLARDGATRSEQARLERLSDRVLGALRQRFDSASQAVHGARGYFTTAPLSTPADWAAYTTAALPAVGPGLVGLGYVERVRRSDIPVLEARMRMLGVPDFRVERAGTREIGRAHV